MLLRFLISLVIIAFSLVLKAEEVKSKLYLNEDYESCVKSSDKDSCYQIYLSGLCYLKLRKYTKARNIFREVIKRYPHSKYAVISLIKLGDAYLLEGKYTEAKVAYKSALEKKRVEGFLPLVYLRLAQVFAKEGNWQKEKEFIDRIKHEYPNSIEKELAQALEKRGFFFTIQVGAFVNFKNAYSLLKELKKRYPAYLVKEKKGKIVFYKVRVGKFKKRKEAQRIYKKLIEEGYPACFYP